MCDDYCDEQADVSDRLVRRARKEHRCYACRETIRRGDKYRETSQLWDGSWSRFRHCLRCWAICEALWAKTDGGFIEYGLDCGEKWVDNFGEQPPEVAALAFMSPDDAQRELVPRA